MPDTETKRYNGWLNYETWCVNLWMTNDQASDSYYREMAGTYWNGSNHPRVVAEHQYWNRSERALFPFADALKDEFEEGKNELLEIAKKECSVWADLLGAALSEVGWSEIADGFLSNIEGYEARK